MNLKYQLISLETNTIVGEAETLRLLNYGFLLRLGLTTYTNLAKCGDYSQAYKIIQYQSVFDSQIQQLVFSMKYIRALCLTEVGRTRLIKACKEEGFMIGYLL